MIFTNEDLLFLYGILKGSIQGFEQARKFDRTHRDLIDRSIDDCKRLCVKIEDEVNTSILSGGDLNEKG